MGWEGRRRVALVATTRLAVVTRGPADRWRDHPGEARETSQTARRRSSPLPCQAVYATRYAWLARGPGCSEYISPPRGLFSTARGSGYAEVPASRTRRIAHGSQEELGGWPTSDLVGPSG